MLAVSNISRAANAVRNRIDSDVLSPVRLTSADFRSCSCSGSGATTRQGLARTAVSPGHPRRGADGARIQAHQPSRHADDGRRVIVALLPTGKETVEKVFPGLNQHEAGPSPSG